MLIIFVPSFFIYFELIPEHFYLLEIETHSILEL